MYHIQLSIGCIAACLVSLRLIDHGVPSIDHHATTERDNQVTEEAREELASLGLMPIMVANLPTAILLLRAHFGAQEEDEA